MPFWRGWAPILIGPTAVVAMVPRDWPPWAFMWLLSVVIYAGCKWLTWRRTLVDAPWWLHAGYLFAWPGLNSPEFLESQRSLAVAKPSEAEWAFAAAKTIVGVSLIWGGGGYLADSWPLAAGWVGMIELVFVLHFGTFHLLSCAWRTFGVQASPLMRWPIAAASVSDFWGRRWNLAFRDLTHRFLFQPLSPTLGPRGALFVGFVFSGLVHDLVITVPARGGYGRPTLFFLIQAVGLLAERSTMGRTFGLGTGLRGRLFTGLVLLGPVALLFPPPFVLGVMLPFLKSIGAA